MASLNMKTKVVTLNGEEVLELCRKATQAVEKAGSPETVNYTITAGLDPTFRIFTVKVFDPEAGNAPPAVKMQFAVDRFT